MKIICAAELHDSDTCMARDGEAFFPARSEDIWRKLCQKIIEATVLYRRLPRKSLRDISLYTEGINLLRNHQRKSTLC